MRRALAILALTATLVALLAGSAGAATAVTAKAQLRGHLPELGESPTMRVFVTQAAYDTYRNSLGDANVFLAENTGHPLRFWEIDLGDLSASKGT